jgi:uncharacterized protein (DUF2062 family)
MNVKKHWRSLRRFVLLRILHADDSPRAIARGAAIGMLIAWTPLMGLHMLIAVVVAAALRANKAIAAALVWLSNPVTFFPMLYFEWLIGNRIIGPVSPHQHDETRRMLWELAHAPLQPRSFLTDLFSLEFWHSLFDLGSTIGLRVWIGAGLMGVLWSAVSYVAVNRYVRWYRARHAARLGPRGQTLAHIAARRLRRAQRRPV